MGAAVGGVGAGDQQVLSQALQWAEAEGRGQKPPPADGTTLELAAARHARRGVAVVADGEGAQHEVAAHDALELLP